MVISLMLITVLRLTSPPPSSFFAQRVWIGEFFCDFEVIMNIWFRSERETQINY